MTFSEKLIRLRKREGISQEELAAYLKVSRQAVSRWEQGTALPDAGNLKKLRQRFGVSVDWLLEDELGWEALSGTPAAEPAPKVPEAPARKSVLPWVLPLCLSGFGMLLMGILASVFPVVYCVGAAAEVGAEAVPAWKEYTGLAGYLKSNQLEWLFWACVVLAAGSLAAGIWQAVGQAQKKPERTDNRPGSAED